MSSLSRWLQRITKRFLPPAQRPKRAAWGGQRHYIMMHFEKTDIDQLELNPNYFGEFDAFVFGHTGYKDHVVTNLIIRGKKFFSYHTMFNYPLPNHIGGGNAWFDWFRSNIQVGLNARMVSGSLIGLFRHFRDSSNCDHSEIVDWAKVTSTGRQLIVDTLFSIRPQFLTFGPMANLFLDQSWPTPPYHFFCDANTPPTPDGCNPCPNGLPFESYTTIATYNANIRDFWDRIHSRGAARGSYSLLNGQFRSELGQPQPFPIYLENTGQYPDGTTFAEFVNVWKQDRRNVLSMIVPNAQYFPQMIEQFRQHGGWVALTGPAAQDPVLMSHYAQLQAVRAAG